MPLVAAEGQSNPDRHGDRGGAARPWSRYGSEEPKQAYIYGQLDLSATELTRGYGWVWSVVAGYSRLS